MLRFKVIAVLCLVLAVLMVANGCAQRFTCIAEGTFVRTPDGEVPIESLKVGSRVTTGDLTGKRAKGTVIAVLESTATIIQRTVLDNGSEVRSTPEHPIATPSGFQKAGSLTVGDVVVVDGGVARVVRISREQKRTRVFDLSVEPGNTFFAAGVLVHNKTVIAPPTIKRLTGRWIGFNIDDTYHFPRLVMDISSDGTFVLEDRLNGRPRAWTGRIETDTAYPVVISQKIKLVPRAPADGEGTIHLTVDAGSIQKARLRAGNGEDSRRLDLDVVFQEVKMLEKFMRD